MVKSGKIQRAEKCFCSMLKKGKSYFQCDFLNANSNVHSVYSVLYTVLGSSKSVVCDIEMDLPSERDTL